MPLTRFAPAPTGLLHLGHVVNAIYVWGLAARLGAGVLLRIEDHDRQRSRPEYEASILDDLDWLGFRPSRFGTDAFRAGACASRQRDRDPIYRAAARALVERGIVYGCVCPRGPSGAGRARVYPGTCRDRAIPADEGVAWRMRIDSSDVTFDDLLCGPIRQDPASAMGDPVIRDRLGNWTYQFAVAVDDHDQGIDLIIRGRDLLASTGLQIDIARIVGRSVPARFAHHMLVMKSPSQKLSKSDGDTGIEALRRQGLRPEEVIGRAAVAAGLAREPLVHAAEAGRLFASLPPDGRPGAG